MEKSTAKTFPYAFPLRASALAEQELISSLSWLVTLRWVGGASVLVATWLGGKVLSIHLPQLFLYLLGLSVLAYNVALWSIFRRLTAKFHSIAVFQWFARIQIGLDWIAMGVLIHLTGGVESPAIFFFFFHIIIASLLLPHDRGFLYVSLAPIVVGVVAVLEFGGILSHVHLVEPTRYDNALFNIGILLFFAASCYTMAYLSMSIARRLRQREDELAALYRSVQATALTLDVPDVLNRLAEVVTQALHCKAAAIRLLDRTGSHLDVVGAYGLSEAYKDKLPIEVARAPIDQQALSGGTVLVDDTTHEERLRHPDKIAAEGIRTILIAPLIGKTGPIGVLRAYGGVGHHFTQDDTAFLSTIAAQGAVAIENAQAYQLLEDLDKSKSQFVRMVTHELRSPVQVAHSLLNVLERGYVGELNEKQVDLIARGRRRIQFLQTLIDDLLDLAAGKADVTVRKERGLVSLNEVCEEVKRRFEARAQEKGLVLRLERPDVDLSVWGDRGELDRMLNNLVGNAVKYTLEGGIDLSLKRVGGLARIEVRDTGIGVSEEDMPHLFEEFFRAENAREVEEAGTGLGLSIVKDLIERYGGVIEAQSVLGRGTTFILELPLAN